MRILITIAALMVALGGGYFWFINYAPSETETAFTAEIKQKLDSYQKIHELSPNLSIFEDTLFQTLRSVERVSAATTSVRAGRDNPFVPF